MSEKTRDRFTVRVSVNITRYDASGYRTADSMSFNDEADIGELDLQEIAGLLLSFHNLSNRAIAASLEKKDNANGEG